MTAKPSPGVVERHARECATSTGEPGLHPRSTSPGCSTPCATIHQRSCASRTDNKAPCDCEPTTGGKLYRTFSGKGAKSAAKAWRSEAVPAARSGAMHATTKQTLREAANAWLDKCARGEVLSRYRLPHAPSALRGYRADLERYVLPDIGGMKLAEIRRGDVQALVNRLNGTGLSGSKIRNVVIPLQAMYRWADQLKMVSYDPTVNLALPETGGRREWSCTPAQGKALLEALPDDVRAVFATALFAGLRRGELRALRVSSLRILNGVGAIDVQHGWDDYEGERETKSRASVREVPMPAALRAILDEHVARLELVGDALLFPNARPRDKQTAASGPFTPSYVQDRADEAWKDAGLERATLHQLRHGYTSWLDAAGVPETRSAATSDTPT